MIELSTVRNPKIPLCGQREYCNSCCNQQSPVIGPEDAAKVASAIEITDEAKVRRMLQDSIKRLQKRKLDPSKLHNKVIVHGESLFSDKNSKLAWAYFEENPVKRMNIEIQKNTPMHVILRELAIHSAELYMKSGNAREIIKSEIEADANHPLRNVRIRLPGFNKPVNDVPTMAEFEWLLGKWVVQRMLKTGRTSVRQEVLGINTEELIFFSQMLLEGEDLSDPCPAIDLQTGLCDIYSAAPALCKNVGGEADALELAIAGCGANAAHCIRNDLVFGNVKLTKQRVSETLRNGSTSLDFLLLVECSRRLQMAKYGQVRGMSTAELLSL